MKMKKTMTMIKDIRNLKHTHDKQCYISSLIYNIRLEPEYSDFLGAFWPVHDSPDQGLPIVLILESLYTKLNVLDQLPFSQTLIDV